MLSQIIAVTALNIRSMPQRFGASAVAAFGIAGVIIVVVTLLSIGEGLRAVMLSTGDPKTVLVLRAGSDTEITSAFYMEHVNYIAEAPDIARDAGVALVSPELVVVANAPLRRSGVDADVPLRGVLPVAFKVHDRLTIVEGRHFTPGSNEIIVGRAARLEYEGLELGASVRWGKTVWHVVGIFEDGRSIAEGEIWCDARVAQPVYNRANSYQSVVVTLAFADRFRALRDSLLTDPRLTVTVMRQADYYAQQSQNLEGLIRGVGLVFGGLMAIAAVFAAVNTMHTAVATRTREIATLRALGFGAAPVVMSVLAEAVCLSLLGGAAGGAAAWAVFDGFQTSTMNVQSLSQVSFSFAVTTRILIEGVMIAVLLGLLGGALPALRAAHLPIVAGLREP